LPYEVFKRTGVRVNTPIVSIGQSGKFALNAAAARILVEAGVKSVLLLWDKDNRKIAIKAAQKSDKNAFAASLVGASNGTIRAKSFLIHIGWTARRRETLPATWNAQEKMFEITLPLQCLMSEKAKAEK
jgi:hypothetical protein